ncbi:hypothetical protein COP2_009748 [Malus domestica]
MLFIFFFLFHSTALTLLFSSLLRDPHGFACIKATRRGHLEKLLQREKEDKNLLEKCIEELKKKGLEFNLLKEVEALRRASSLRVEAKAVRKWNARDLVILFFFIVSSS